MKRNDFKQNKKRGSSEVSSSIKLPPVNSKLSVSNNLTLNAISQQEEGLISILHEYFIKNNYLDTLDSFQKDCCKPMKLNPKNQEQMKKQLLALFDRGQRDAFFVKFAQFVPISMRNKDVQTMRIEFYLELYFFIYNIHPFLGKKKGIETKAKKSFIEYLQGRGAPLSKLSEFLNYYGLTNVQKPQQHPLFKALFSKEWAVEFRKRIAFFFQKLYPANKMSTLVFMYDKFIQNLEKQSQGLHTEQDEDLEILQEIEEQNNDINPEPVLFENVNQSEANKSPKEALFKGDFDQIEMLKANIEQLHEEKDNLFQHLEGEKSKSQHWQNIYKEFSEAAQNIIMESQTKWFQITQQIYSITDEILTVCKKLQEGIPLSEPDIIDKISHKLGKYERFMKMKIEEIIEGENFDFSVFTPAGEDDSVMLNRVGKGGKLIQLDFVKISACLREPQVPNGGQAANKSIWESKILLLQALKWRINRARSALAKREAVLSYTTYDILGLKDKEDKTLVTLINSQNEYLVLETIGVISALTKDYYGRQYLVCQKLYEPIVKLFADGKTNQQAKIQLLFSLQICSTKKFAQQLMIRYEMIKIIIRKIQKQIQTIQPHYLEYLVALLINILLHKEGPKKAEQIKQEIMKTLINLIQCENMGIRSLIHGSLYPLLCHEAFRQQAKKFGLLDNIKFLLQNNKSEQHQNQLIYLKQKLQKDKDEPTGQQKQDSQDNNDQDQFFSEEYRQEVEQYVQININGIKGEELLMKQYLLLGPESLTQRNIIQDKVSETLKKKQILMDNSFYERQSVSTPLINNKIRRNISNNNSVYSNKSSNRVLKSEKNSRSQINTNQNIQNPNIPKDKLFKEKLDTVHQNNSEVSIKQYEQKNIIDPNLEETFRRAEQPIVSSNNESQFQKKSQVKVYENTEEYKNIFLTRAKIVRTPPRK